MAEIAKEAIMENTQTAVLESETDRNNEATPGSARRLMGQIRRRTYRKISAEDKIRIVLEGFRKELPISDLCRKERINVSVYYGWLKDFMEAGKSRLKGDSIRSANEDDVTRLKDDNVRLKQLAGEQALEISLLKKSLNA